MKAHFIVKGETPIIELPKEITKLYPDIRESEISCRISENGECITICVNIVQNKDD